MSKIVLDSSAFIALLNQEDGADIVESHIPDVIMSCVNLSEIAVFFIQAKIPELEIKNILENLLAEQVIFNAEQAFMAANFRGLTKSSGLGLGDRACLSLAKLKNLPVLTADRAWANLVLDIDIRIIR